MNFINIYYHKTKIGELLLGSYKDKLCLLNFTSKKTRKTVDHRIKTGLNATFVEQDNDFLVETRRQINEYLNGDRKVFDLPLCLVGSDFQKRVWTALLKVPYGVTSTYLQLAKDINYKKAVRAVANANGANAISLIIPCHRIIGTNGKLVGYGGGLSAKKQLLDIERKHG